MKKTTYKRVLSLALTLMTLISCAPAHASAYEAADENEKTTVTFQSSGNGLYQINSPNSVNMHTRGALIQATSTENEDVFYMSSNKYLVLSYDDNYVLTEKVAVDVNDFSPQDYQDIPFEVLDSLQKDIERQISMGNRDFTAAIYSPVAEVTYEPNSSLSSQNYWGNEYPCGPYTLKDYFVELGNANTGMVSKRGKNASTWAASLFNLVISGGGLASKTVSIFGVGISALDFFESLFDKVEQTNTSDYISEDTVYNKLGKSTYVLDGDMWLFSLGTQKITITEVNVYQFYASDGHTSYEPISKNSVHKTENYDNPNMAIQMMGVGYMDPNYTHKVFDQTYVF